MTDVQIAMTALRQRLGDLVKRAAYGNERIILLSHGAPQAAIIGLADLERLQALDVGAESPAPVEALAAAARVRQRIQAWQEAHGVPASDVVADLNELREVRDAAPHHLR